MYEVQGMFLRSTSLVIVCACMIDVIWRIHYINMLHQVQLQRSPHFLHPSVTHDPVRCARGPCPLSGPASGQPRPT